VCHCLGLADLVNIFALWVWNNVFRSFSTQWFGIGIFLGKGEFDAANECFLPMTSELSPSYLGIHIDTLRMPQTSWTSSPFYQFLFLVIFILAFFPSAFQSLLKLPLLPFTFSYSRTPAASSPRSCPHGCLPPPNAMSWFQKTFTLPSRSRGSYLITSEVESALPEISSYKVGLLNLFVQHTSCALSMNENWDEEVREDMSDALDRIAPEDRKGNLYRHAAEGKDDMPVRNTIVHEIA
jgi:secondary thiamine-phosphate synthase enzyme